MPASTLLSTFYATLAKSFLLISVYYKMITFDEIISLGPYRSKWMKFRKKKREGNVMLENQEETAL